MTIPENLKPLNLPPVPSLIQLKHSENPKRLIIDWENNCREIQKLNDQRFKKALKRIQTCAFLHGMLNPFGAGTMVKHHYGWCPEELWTSPRDNLWK